MTTRLMTRPAAIALMSLLLAALPLQAMTVRLMNLQEQTQAAGMILAGTVTKVESRLDEHGLPATFITIAVTEKIKGVQDDVVTIKQFGFQKGQANGTALQVADMPRYRSQEQVILFLHQPSHLGFTSPVGLGQGKYTVMRTSPDKAFVQNQMGNRNLTQMESYGVPQAGVGQQPGSPHGQAYDYQTFLSAIRQTVQDQGQ